MKKGIMRILHGTKIFVMSSIMMLATMLCLSTAYASSDTSALQEAGVDLDWDLSAWGTDLDTENAANFLDAVEDALAEELIAGGMDPTEAWEQAHEDAMGIFNDLVSNDQFVIPGHGVNMDMVNDFLANVDTSGFDEYFEIMSGGGFNYEEAVGYFSDMMSGRVPFDADQFNDLMAELEGLSDFADYTEDFMGEADELLGDVSNFGISGAMSWIQHLIWIMDDFYKEIEPTFKDLTEQMTAVGLYHAFMVGAFFDAKHQLETQRLFQKLTAEAHRDYQPSVQICKVGTNVRSLAAAEGEAEMRALVMDERAIDRHLGSRSSNAGNGDKEDKEGRLAQFKVAYCDYHDNNHYKNKNDTGLALLCTGSAVESNDVNYERRMGIGRTMDQEDAMAMASYLYGNETFTRPPMHLLKDEANQGIYMDLRAVIAKRSVAEHSFNIIAGMKMKSKDAAKSPMESLMSEIGITGAPLVDWGSMSYLAQMEILTKRLYERIGFYTDLYDKPVNVRRMNAALKALGLMLERDIYDSYLRSEMLMSILLEIKTIRKQQEVQNSIRNVKAGG